MTAPARRSITAAFVDELLAFDGAVRGSRGKAGLCLLDYLSCCFAGLRFASAQQAVRAAAPWAVANGAPLIGTALKLSPSEAGYVNSVLAVSASRTDMHPAITSHIGPVVFPAALACAALRPVSGAEFLDAVAAGYEAEGRVGRVLVNDHFMKHHRATSILGSVGGAIAAARVLGLDPAQATNALSISVNAAAGLMQWGHSGGLDLLYQPANAVRAAVSAAILAREGTTSSEAILEGRGGLLDAFGDPAAADRLQRPWSSRPEIDFVEFKAVPSCVFVQAAAFAALSIAGNHGPLTADEIAFIRLRTFASAIAYPGCDDPGPITAVQPARMSLQFTVASVLARGGLGDRNYAEFDEPRTQALLTRVAIEEGAEFTVAYPARQGAEVQVRLHSGRLLSGRVDEVPVVTAERVRARFLESAHPVVGAERAERIEQMALGLADEASVVPLLGLIAVAPA